MADVTSEQRKDVVNAKSVAYGGMEARWELIHALQGGTLQMRADGELWLPKEEEEVRKSYEARLNRSILYEAYTDTIEKIVAKPFQQPVALVDIPKGLEYLEKDTDKTKTSLTDLGRSLLADLCNYGKAHILVDFTTLPQNAEALESETPPASIAQEKAAGARATMVKISPPDLIGWQSEEDDNGQPLLTQIRIHETKIMAKGSYLDEEVEFVRVYERDAWSLHRLGSDGAFHKEKDGLNSLGVIPFITIYATKAGFMVAFPPLEKLAWLNLAHYQSDSDQRNILRIGRFGILFAKGLTKQEAKKGLLLGPFQMYASSSNEADLKYVEHNGKAMAAGREDLQDLVDRMEVMGHQPLVKKQAQGTATGKKIDKGETNSILQSWIRALETGIKGAYVLAASWHKAVVLETFGVDIFSDFQVADLGSDDEEFLLDMFKASALSGETLLEEIKRRGTLADSLKVEEEMERIAAQGPALGLLGTEEDEPEEESETGLEDEPEEEETT